MAIPGLSLPPLQFSLPSTATAVSSAAPVFNFGSGSAGGLPPIVMYGALALAAYYLFKKKGA